jgi:WD40 repeat protein
VTAGDTTPRAATTAVACFSPKTVFVGHSDGSARALNLTTGAIVRTYTPPADSAWEATDMTVPAAQRAASPRAPSKGAAEADRSVAAIALFSDGPMKLAVGHRDGTIHIYDAGSAKWLMAFATPAGLTQLLSLRKFGYLAALHDGVNTLQLWNLSADKSIVLDFNAELESVNKRLTKMAHATWDEARRGA